MNAPLLCIMGPTASGKTNLAIALAQALDGELISVDSALVYRGLDIGSAKPGYPHHLVDICDPSEAYSAARFVKDAQEAIESVRSRGRRPILVGGTMLYYNALLRGLAAMPGANEAARKEIASMAAQEGWPAVHRELARVDPESAARIHPNHSQRLSRALEVYRLTGKTLTYFHEQEQLSPLDITDALAIAIAPASRQVLHTRIETRFLEMMNAGFLDEVRSLRERGDLHADLPAIRAVGYRQLWSYLAGECSLDEAQERAIIATRQLAKRQLTWLRKWPDLHWIHTDVSGAVLESDLAKQKPILAKNTDPADLLLNYLTYDPM
ncbi:tRNA (adenosine(37)-N6)-dimethylallyltransferase MiaA [Congregibacter variabilis]|uniref:tRNA dimethylallyltransferase n=2 Tax=Congregibacter variabilis TaxID=3081200 RepID=A0ABZ0I0M2_9GAMM|nr:tRNA (adenosine(37)-N6)-dimethylallyltransferase MiaA [Congregibacter sp. IMCC43200]